MKINGEEFTLTDPVTAEVLLIQQGYDPQRVAVEKNGEILPKAQFQTAWIQNDDVLEVVRFVGGG